MFEIYGIIMSYLYNLNVFNIYIQIEADGPFVLLTHLSGNALYKMAEKSDKEIVTKCVKILEKLFPEEVKTSHF